MFQTINEIERKSPWFNYASPLREFNESTLFKLMEREIKNSNSYTSLKVSLIVEPITRSVEPVLGGER